MTRRASIGFLFAFSLAACGGEGPPAGLDEPPRSNPDAALPTASGDAGVVDAGHEAPADAGESDAGVPSGRLTVWSNPRVTLVRGEENVVLAWFDGTELDGPVDLSGETEAPGVIIRPDTRAPDHVGAAILRVELGAEVPFGVFPARLSGRSGDHEASFDFELHVRGRPGAPYDVVDPQGEVYAEAFARYRRASAARRLADGSFAVLLSGPLSEDHAALAVVVFDAEGRSIAPESGSVWARPGDARAFAVAAPVTVPRHAFLVDEAPLAFLAGFDFGPAGALGRQTAEGGSARPLNVPPRVLVRREGELYAIGGNQVVVLSRITEDAITHHVLPGPADQREERAVAAVATERGFLVAGNTGAPGSFDRDIFTMLVSPEGELLERHVYPLPGDDLVTELAPEGNGFILAASSYTDREYALTLHLGPTGEVLDHSREWEPMYAGLVVREDGMRVSAAGLVEGDRSQLALVARQRHQGAPQDFGQGGVVRLGGARSLQPHTLLDLGDGSVLIVGSDLSSGVGMRAMAMRVWGPR